MVPSSPAGARSLDALRAEAARDPRAAARHAAVQFEAVFAQMVLKSMRDATPKAQGDSMGTDHFTAMLDAHFANHLAGRPGGLAAVIERQLSRHAQNLPAPQAPAAALPASDAAPARGGRAADFIRQMLPHAQEAERRTGVPADFILGQAALESGWGQAQIRNADGSPSHNLFGIKSTPQWRGATAEASTTEFEAGTAHRRREGFRSYASYADAFADYARLLGTQQRYAQVLAQPASPEQFASGMQRAGYATDPHYAAKLARTIHHAQGIRRALG